MQFRVLILSLLAAVAAAAPASSAAAASSSAAADSGAADFGKCTPTISFEFGRPGRSATEGTFLPTDPLLSNGQQDALNPNIITNEVCDRVQDQNICAGNAAAESLCLAAKAQVAALGTKDASTAAAFNAAVGFPTS